MRYLLLSGMVFCTNALAAPTLNVSANTEQTFAFNMTQLAQSVSVGNKVSQFQYSEPGRQLVYGGTGLAGGADATYGPVWYKTDYNYGNVSSSMTIPYDGIRYRKLLNINSDDVFFAFRQQIYDNEKDVMTYPLAPFTANNAAKTTLRRNLFPGPCRQFNDNVGWSTTCTPTATIITVNTGISGDNGTLYFYFDKKPTKTITFYNYHVVSTKMSKQFIPGYQSTYPGDGTMMPYNKFVLTGSIVFNNSCRVFNNGLAVAIPLGSVSAAKFTSKGALPNNVTAVTTNIEFNCDNDINSTYGSNSIKWSVRSAAESTTSEASNGILKAVAAGGGNTINNLGVQLKSPQNGNNKINATGAVNYPTTISGKKAIAQITAYPTMINNTKPSGAGDYKATATITFNIP